MIELVESRGELGKQHHHDTTTMWFQGHLSVTMVICGQIVRVGSHDVVKMEVDSVVLKLVGKFCFLQGT